jgi:hypothetical protein
MFELTDPICPKCGSKVRETVSEFLFSGEQPPTMETALARITGHKCGCGHKFAVVAYQSSEQREANRGSKGEPGETKSSAPEFPGSG